MQEDDFLTLLEKEIFHNRPTANRSYFLDWSLDMIYEIEPSLKDIAAQATAYSTADFYKKLDIYTQTKNKVYKLIGWGARDPRLRQTDAWDCYFNYIVEGLRL